VDELFRKLDQTGARYLLIGGQAMRLRGMPRYSLDWDFFIPPRDAENFARLNAALATELESPLEELGPRGEAFVQTHNTRWGVVQFHLLVPGVPDFDAAARRSVERTLESGVIARCLGGADLLAAKQAANRPQDQPDLLFLREQQAHGKLDE
jgi:hypothetical protein